MRLRKVKYIANSLTSKRDLVSHSGLWDTDVCASSHRMLLSWQVSGAQGKVEDSGPTSVVAHLGATELRKA